MQEVDRMRKRNFKGRCEKRMIGKCTEVCRTYDAIQYAYADLLQGSDEVKEIRCNVLLDGLDVGKYTSDFVCTKVDGDLMVRECVFRKFLMKPLTVKLLDASREYWLRHGVTDWGAVSIERRLVAMKAFHDAGVRTTCFISIIFLNLHARWAPP